ncbi:MAG: glycosyltransferase [Halioglobus sp.]
MIAATRQVIGALPGAKPLYARIMDRRFERRANALSGAVYHETNYVLKPYKGPCVTTVHDLSHIRFAQFHPRHVIDWLDRGLPASLERADCVITVSNLVRDELLQHFDIPECKVRTVYEVWRRVTDRARRRKQPRCCPVTV